MGHLYCLAVLDCTAPRSKPCGRNHGCVDATMVSRLLGQNLARYSVLHENFRTAQVNFGHLIAAHVPFMLPSEEYVRIHVPFDKKVMIALYR